MLLSCELTESSCAVCQVLFSALLQRPVVGFPLCVLLQGPSSAESHIHIHTSPSSSAPVSYRIPRSGVAATPMTSTHVGSIPTPQRADAAVQAEPALHRRSSWKGQRDQQQQADGQPPPSPHPAATSLVSRPTQTEAVSSASGAYTQTPASPRQPRASHPMSGRSPRKLSTSQHLPASQPSPYRPKSVSPIVASASLADGQGSQLSRDAAAQTIGRPVEYSLRPSSALCTILAVAWMVLILLHKRQDITQCRLHLTHIPLPDTLNSLMLVTAMPMALSLKHPVECRTPTWHLVVLVAAGMGSQVRPMSTFILRFTTKLFQLNAHNQQYPLLDAFATSWSIVCW